MDQSILVVGNVGDGLRFYGPFESSEVALEAGDRHFKNEPWVAPTLHGIQGGVPAPKKQVKRAKKNIDGVPLMPKGIFLYYEPHGSVYWLDRKGQLIGAPQHLDGTIDYDCACYPEWNALEDEVFEPLRQLEKALRAIEAVKNAKE